MVVDKEYCMSSFLTVRYVADMNKTFKEGMTHEHFRLVPDDKKINCDSADEIDRAIKKILGNYNLSKAAIMLSGGMDSAILASYMPKGTRAYTARCKAPNCVDETERAAYYCEQYGLEHVIVDVSWEDYLDSMDELMLKDGSPLFANEPQVYTITKKIVEDGADLVVFGDHADIAFGGMDKLLSKDWTYDEWKKRYTFVDPFKVLKHPVDVDSIFAPYKGEKIEIDYMKFMDEVFAMSSTGAYMNAFRLANITSLDPYSYMQMSQPLDLSRVRAGESKYHIRELFRKKYPERPVPEKIAMARAVDQWLKNWEGPVREEFIPDCTEGMTGEQKFLIYSLERFLNLIDERH